VPEGRLRKGPHRPLGLVMHLGVHLREAGSNKAKQAAMEEVRALGMVVVVLVQIQLRVVVQPEPRQAAWLELLGVQGTGFNLRHCEPILTRGMLPHRHYPIQLGAAGPRSHCMQTREGIQRCRGGIYVILGRVFEAVGGRRIH
jgi:hypothetical protein